MPIIFSAVARGSLVLAESANCTGNFADVTREVLKKVPNHDDILTYTSGNYHFHYVAANRLIYFCITDNQFPRDKAFCFLKEVKKKFLLLFGDTPSAALPSAALRHPSDGDFARILEKEMERFNDNKASLPKMQAELAELKSIMVKNVERMVQRGALIDDVLNRTEGLAENSTTYVVTTQKVQRKYWWQNMRMYVILAMVSPLLVYFIGAMACGGLKWKSCVG